MSNMRLKMMTDPKDIADAMVNAYPGIGAECCGKCKVKINTFSNRSGYFCPNCEHFNVQRMSGYIMPWDYPDYGPTTATLNKAVKLAEQISFSKRKFKVRQVVAFCETVSHPTMVGVIEEHSFLHPSMLRYMVRVTHGHTTPRGFMRLESAIEPNVWHILKIPVIYINDAVRTARQEIEKDINAHKGENNASYN